MNPTYFLSWIPESLLNGRADLNKFVRAEKDMASVDVEDEGKCTGGRPSLSLLMSMIPIDMVLVDAPAPRGESYTFSVPITSLYSLTAAPPTISSWRTSDLHIAFCSTDNVASQMVPYPSI